MFTLAAPRNAEALRWRWSGHPTMLHRLCELPFAYYCEPRLRSVLLPTLLCACLHDTVNLRILSSRLAPVHLLTFLRISAAGGAASSTGENQPPPSPTSAPPSYTPPAVLIDDPSELPIVSMNYDLAARLPPEMWNEAIAFFSTRPESPAPDFLGVEPPPLAANDSETSGAHI